MLSNKIKALFKFIEFLHSNIDNFKQYDKLWDEINSLVCRKNVLKPLENYTDKLERDELDTEIKPKFNIIDVNIIKPIREKAIEFDICNFDDEPNYNWYHMQTDIALLKYDVCETDLPIINKHKNMYKEYREKIETDYGQSFFFNEFYEILNSLFVYFEPELKRFETKTIQVKTKAELKQVLMKESEFDEYVNVYAANLKGLTKQNVNNVFEANYKRFKYYKSDWVTNNGVYLKTTLERWLHTLPGKNSDGQKISNLGHVVCSNTIKGITITKEMFAECVLEYHEKQKEKLTIGLNTDKIVKNEQLKIYIEFLENYLKPNNNPEALPPPPIAKQKTEKLEQLFEYTSKYKTVMEIFVDKQFIHAQTYIWKDEKANNKSLMCALVKDLEGKGYYKQEIKMNYELCKTICKNTFHVTIGSNKTYYNSALPRTMIGLIPFASTLE